ncbi:MAG: hypothetical protein EXX96DRAFT_582797 [Benjaminiella poitrasii]|nr:MAG: hypothetical protein EXX96DRAFT_582797 [Benjaminiella poitrasii]
MLIYNRRIVFMTHGFLTMAHTVTVVISMISGFRMETCSSNIFLLIIPRGLIVLMLIVQQDAHRSLLVMKLGFRTWNRRELQVVVRHGGRAVVLVRHLRGRHACG